MCHFTADLFFQRAKRSCVGERAAEYITLIVFLESVYKPRRERIFHTHNICWETDPLHEKKNTTGACCKHAVSAQGMIQKVFAINSVCFNLLTKPDGQSLRHKNNCATERRLFRLTARVPEGKKRYPKQDPLCFSFTSPKGRRDLFKTPVYVWECSSPMQETRLWTIQR